MTPLTPTLLDTKIQSLWCVLAFLLCIIIKHTLLLCEGFDLCCAVFNIPTDIQRKLGWWNCFLNFYCIIELRGQWLAVPQWLIRVNSLNLTLCLSVSSPLLLLLNPSHLPPILLSTSLILSLSLSLTVSQHIAKQFCESCNASSNMYNSLCSHSFMARGVIQIQQNFLHWN